MRFQRKALYNLLRMNWLLDPSLGVEDWQIADYRQMPLAMLFEKLSEEGIEIDQHAFQLFADHFESPEEMTDTLVEESEASTEQEDRIYLLVFELWRRLVPQQPCLSVFCDELDHLINLYDRQLLTSLEPLEDILATLQELLLEIADSGADPEEAFATYSQSCAHNLEDFLNDFLLDQLDAGNIDYAGELIEGFQEFIHDKEWFDLHRIRILEETDPHEANAILAEIVYNIEDEPHDLEFNLELLSYLVENGNRQLFRKVTERILRQIELEEDFQDLLGICADYYQRLDEEEEEKKVLQLLEARDSYDIERAVSQDDEALRALKQIMQI